MTSLRQCLLPVILLSCQGKENAAPLVELTSHADGVALAEGYPETFQGMVTDADHGSSALQATWYVGTEAVCPPTAPDADGNTRCTIVAGADDTSVSLEVQDAAGDVGVALIAVSVLPTEAPTAEIDAPSSDGVYYSDMAVTLSGMAADPEEDPTTLAAWWESDLDGQLDATIEADGTVTGEAVLQEGRHTISLLLEDVTGKLGSDRVDIQVGPPSTPPDCQIAAPVSGAVSELGVAVVLEGLAADVDVPADWLQVAWSSDIDGSLGADTPDSAGAFSRSTEALTVATHQLTLTVTDEVGLACTDQISYTVGTAPTLVVTAPASGAVVNERDAVRFLGSVTDNEDPPSDVTLSWDSDLDGAFSAQGADPDGAIDFTVDTLNPGEHTLTAVATDPDGLSASATIRLTINARPTQPTVTLTPNPAETGDTISASASGSVDPDKSGEVTYQYAWYDGTDRTTVTDSAFPSSETEKDRTYTVVVTPSDGLGDGTPGEASLTVANTDPTLTSISLSASTAAVGDTVSCAATATDSDPGDAVDISYTWSDGTTASAYTLVDSDDPGDTITCTAVADDGDGGTDTDTASLTVDNTDPVVDSVSLPSGTHRVGDTLSCSATASDADGGAPTISYLWSGGTTGTTYRIPTSDDPGDTITCTATASDLDGGEATGSASIIVTNSEPAIASVTVGPSGATNDDTLSCEAPATDADGEAPEVRFSWLNQTTSASLGTDSTVELSASVAASADTIQCTATASDDDGGSVSKDGTIVLQNRPPTISLTALPSTASRSDTLRCEAAVDDEDGDELTTTFAWLVAGTSADATTTGALQSTLADAFSPGDAVSCTATTSDEKGGADEATTSTTITNSAPVLSAVTFGQDTLRTNDTLTAAVTATDADDDGLTLSYDWTVNSSIVQTGASNALDGRSWFDRDDVVSVKVTAEDGYDTTAVSSSAFFVSNSPPTAPEVRILPEAPEAGDDLTCVVDADSDDDDDDAVTYTVSWTVNGAGYVAGGAEDTGSLDTGGGWSGPGTTAWPGDTVDGADVEAGSRWLCAVTPLDEAGLSGESATTSADVGLSVSFYITADDKLDDVYIDGAIVTVEPSSWNNRVVYHTITLPYTVSLSSGSHILAIKARDTGVVRAFMAAVIADEEVLAATGDGTFLVTETDPGSDWEDADFDDSGWDTPTSCTYVHADWNNTSNGFYGLQTDHGATRVWLGNTCSSGGSSSIWFRVTFEVP
jgi:hypothetical protein